MAKQISIKEAFNKTPELKTKLEQRENASDNVSANKNNRESLILIIKLIQEILNKVLKKQKKIPTSVKPKVPEKLAVNVELLGTEKEKQRITGIANKIAKSPLGRETLEVATKAGYKIEIVEGMRCIGLCDPNKKILSLNAKFSDETLSSTIAHEARHAIQFTNGASIIGEKNIKSQIMVSRAMEADAQRTACVTGWELKQKGDSSVYDAFKKFYPNIAKKLKEASKKGKNIDLAAFKAWYDNNGTKSAYEDIYIKSHYEDENNHLAKFSKNYTGKETIDMICVARNGKNYFTEDPKILENGKFLDVEQDTMDFLKDFMKHREKTHGLKADASINKLPIRKKPTKKFAFSAKEVALDKRQVAARQKIAEIKAKRARIANSSVITAMIINQRQKQR